MKIKVVQHPAGTVRIIEGDFGRIVQKADENCARCDTDAYVPHYNCLYNGNAVGHSAAHCTANACY
jgi:hypothetical protein